MINEDDLQAAVADGIIDQAQAVRIAHVARLRRQGSAPASRNDEAITVDPDDERFRLIGGFNDIFVTIGLGMLASALFGFSSLIGLEQFFALTGAVLAWGLSEWFSRRMRLALPSIVLAIMFAGACALLGAIALSVAIALIRPDMSAAVGPPFIAAGLAGASAAWLHHWRFRVPIDHALTAIGLVAALAGLLDLAAPTFLRAQILPLAVLVGLCLIAVALRLDMTDPKRLTRRSDAAFWLHLLAAGLIVHPIFRDIAFSSGIGVSESVLILSLFTLLGVVALVIDRRALLVSALSYAGIAIAYLITQSVSANLALPLALLGLAVLVLALSAGWRQLRRLIVPRLPLGMLAARLPPVEAPLP